MDEQKSPQSSDWVELPPEHIPKPTAWPPTLALAVTFLFWGLASSLIISAVGVLVFAVALTGWIGDIRHERQPH